MDEEFGALMAGVLIFCLGIYLGFMSSNISHMFWIEYKDSEDKSCRTYRISHEGMPFTDVYTVCQKGVISK